MKHNYKFFYKKLEIDQILSELKNYAVLENTAEFLDNLCEENDLNKLNTELDNVYECYRILTSYGSPSILMKKDLLKILKFAQIHAMLSPNDLWEIVLLNSSIRMNQLFCETLQKNNFKSNYFINTINSLNVTSSLDNAIRKAIEEDGYILDDATPTLKSIRNRLKGIDGRIKEKLKEIINHDKDKLAESLVVIRDDCYCLAVKSEYKNSFKGILHDTSSSNQTAYMEPISVANLTSEKVQLKKAEKIEIETILQNLSNLVFADIETLYTNYQIFIELDILFSKANLGRSYNGSRPLINNQGILELKNLRHPLLKVDKVVPNDINFGKNLLGIVITGPNTGGKTVLIKSVGLICLMTKFGLLIPADEGSKVTIYDHVYCDIGDDQSIEDNLSTFSSHMNSMVQIVNQVTPNSLVLLDEIGSGTDPVEGASLAVAILSYFLKNNVSFITTSHYQRLKNFAYSEERVTNASMEFSQTTNKPTYRLLIGKTGSSNALSVAMGLGLKKEIIDAANKELDSVSDDASKLMKKLEQRSSELSIKEEQVEALIAQNESLIKKYKIKLNNIENEKRRILEKAKQDAEKQIEEITKNGLEVLDNIKKMQDSDIKLHEIINAKRKLKDLEVKENTSKKSKKSLHVNYKVGDYVFIDSYNQNGEIIKINKNGTYDVSVGNVVLHLKKKDLEVGEKPVDSAKVQDTGMTSLVYERKRVSLSLDLRGKLYDEAKDLIDKYFDDLVIANIKECSIIHGFGTGTIRELVQNYCKKSPFVKSFRYGGAGEGGLGATIVTLK